MGGVQYGWGWATKQGDVFAKLVYICAGKKFAHTTKCSSLKGHRTIMYKSYEVRFLFGRSTMLRNDRRYVAFWKHILQLPNSTVQILTHQNVHLKYKYTNFWRCKIYVNRVNN